MNERAAWYLVFVLLGLLMMTWVDRVIISMLVTPIKDHLALSDLQMGLILGPAFGVAYAVAGLPMGWAADRYPRRIVIFAGVMVWSMATIACGFAGSFAELLVARIFVGVGEAALLPAAYSLIADSFSRDRLTYAASVFQMGGKLGPAFAYGAGASAIAFIAAHQSSFPSGLSERPWQLVMMMVGIPCAIIGLLLFTIVEPSRRRFGGAGGGFAASLAFVRDHRRLMLLLALGFAFLSICGFAFSAWLPTYVERHFGLRPIDYGMGLSLMNILSAILLVFSGKIVDHLFVRGMADAHLRYYTWKIALLIPVLLGMFFLDDIYIFLALYCYFALVTAPVLVYVSALSALLAPQAIRAQIIAMFLFIFTIAGAALGPTSVSTLTDRVFQDEARLGTSIAIVCVGSLLLALAFMRGALLYLAPALGRQQAE